MVDGPGTIGLHPKGRNTVEGGRRRLFCFALQSRRRRKKIVAGRCWIEIEAALASQVFGQTRSIEIAVGVVWSAGKGNYDMAAIGQHILLRRQRLRWLPRRQAPQPQRQVGEVPSRSSWGEIENGPDFRPCCLLETPSSERHGRSLPVRRWQSLLLGEAGRFLVLLSGRLHAGMAGADSEDMALIWSFSCVID